VRQWGLKFGQGFANRIRRRRPRAGDKWHAGARSTPAGTLGALVPIALLEARSRPGGPLP